MDTTKKIAVMLGVCFVTSLSVAGATFHPGDKGHQITEIQQALTAHGYDTDADGDYGDSTQAAVRQFQADHGLDCDGIMAPLRMKPSWGKPCRKTGLRREGRLRTLCRLLRQKMKSA